MYVTSIEFKNDRESVVKFKKKCLDSVEEKRFVTCYEKNNL